MRLGLDYAGGRPTGFAIKAARYDFAVRYLSSGGPVLPGKLLTPAEADDLRANGVSIVANWETWADRMLDGHDAGVQDAKAALAQAKACGMPDHRPIYFSADWDATPGQQAAIDAYLTGAGEVLGAGNVGIYGGYWPVSRAKANGTAHWFWQTEAWSGGNVVDGRHLHQRLGFVTVDTVQCDVNEALTDDFGQWDYPVTAPLPVAPMNDHDLLEDIRAQITGGLTGYPGWWFLNDNTVPEALGVIGEHLGIPGYKDPKKAK